MTGDHPGGNLLLETGMEFFDVRALGCIIASHNVRFAV